MQTALDFLTALGRASAGGFWLPVALWTGVASLAWAGLRAWRGAHPQVQYAAHLALLLALPVGLLAALTDVVFFTLPAPVLTAAVPDTAEPISRIAVSPGAPVAAEPVPAALPLLGVLTLAALGAAVVRSLQLLGQAAALFRFRRRLPAPDRALQAATDRLAARMDVYRPVRVAVHPHVAVPMTFGRRRPVVVLPAALADDEDARDLALRHELTHVRRGDYAWQWFEQTLRAVFAFHPLVGALCRSLATYREMACDAEVLRDRRLSRKAYAHLLFRFLDLPHRPATIAVGMAEPVRDLKRRITALTSYPTQEAPMRTPKLLGLTVAAALLAVCTTVVACTDVLDVNVNLQSEAEKTAPAEARFDADETFVVVEEMPVLVGGLEAIQQDIEYPVLAKKAGIEGRVIVQFVVDEKGRVHDAKVVRGIGGGCDEEALRAVREARFTPGRQRGRTVPVRMSLPITFKLGADAPSETTAAVRSDGLTFSDFVLGGDRLTGRVLTQGDRRPVAAASLSLEVDGRTIGATTDEDGRFVLKGVPTKGAFGVDVRHASFPGATFIFHVARTRAEGVNLMGSVRPPTNDGALFAKVFGTPEE